MEKSSMAQFPPRKELINKLLELAEYLQNPENDLTELCINEINYLFRSCYKPEWLDRYIDRNVIILGSEIADFQIDKLKKALLEFDHVKTLPVVIDDLLSAQVKSVTVVDGSPCTPVKDKMPDITPIEYQAPLQIQDIDKIEKQLNCDKRKYKDAKGHGRDYKFHR